MTFLINKLRQFFGKSVKKKDLIEEYDRVVEKLERRSELEEIGTLTASIEHEIKNPLAVIESEIERMSWRFQGHPEIMKGLERIRAQKQRIYDITKIIPILRADATLHEKSMVKTSIQNLVHQSIASVKKEVNTRRVSFQNSGADYFVMLIRRFYRRA
jgi:signal transduction histidine kinase